MYLKNGWLSIICILVCLLGGCKDSGDDGLGAAQLMALLGAEDTSFASTPADGSASMSEYGWQDKTYLLVSETRTSISGKKASQTLYNYDSLYRVSSTTATTFNTDAQNAETSRFVTRYYPTDNITEILLPNGLVSTLLHGYRDDPQDPD